MIGIIVTIIFLSNSKERPFRIPYVTFSKLYKSNFYNILRAFSDLKILLVYIANNIGLTGNIDKIEKL